VRGRGGDPGERHDREPVAGLPQAGIRSAGLAHGGTDGGQQEGGVSGIASQPLRRRRSFRAGRRKSAYFEATHRPDLETNQPLLKNESLMPNRQFVIEKFMESRFPEREKRGLKDAGRTNYFPFGIFCGIVDRIPPNTSRSVKK
jgi:hypothetical protein